MAVSPLRRWFLVGAPLPYNVLGGVCVGIALVLGCAPATKDAPFRSPSHDYPRPPVTTSDGKVVGADSKPPEDWIREHATTGGPSEGWARSERGSSDEARKKPSRKASEKAAGGCLPKGEVWRLERDKPKDRCE